MCIISPSQNLLGYQVIMFETSQFGRTMRRSSTSTQLMNNLKLRILGIMFCLTYTYNKAHYFFECWRSFLLYKDYDRKKLYQFVKATFSRNIQFDDLPKSQQIIYSF